MAMRARQKVDRLLTEAEQAGRCAFTDDANLAQALYRSTRAGEMVSPLPRLFARRGYWQTLSPAEKAFHQMRAWVMLHPGTTFCGPSAALVHGLSVPERHLSLLHVATPPAVHGRSSSRLIRHVVSDSRSTVLDGMRVTTLTRTIYDCLRMLDQNESLELLESIASGTQFSKSDLAHAISHEYAGRRDITRVLSRLPMTDVPCQPCSVCTRMPTREPARLR